MGRQRPCVVLARRGHCKRRAAATIAGRTASGPAAVSSDVMATPQDLLVHFLAALAYRTQKALRGAPPSFGTFSAGHGVRTPAELVRHMTSVLGYARTCFIGGRYRADPLPDLMAEIARFHEMLGSLAGHLRAGDPLLGVTPEQLLQGPFSDAMTHAGQLALLRRLAGVPVAPENFIDAEVSAAALGPDQPLPRSPDPIWPEAPPGWTPES